MKKCLAIFDCGFGYGDCFISIPTIMEIYKMGYKVRLITLDKNIPIFKLLPEEIFSGIFHMNSQQLFYEDDFDLVINGQYWWYNGTVRKFGSNVMDAFARYNRIFTDEIGMISGLLPELNIPRDVRNKIKNLIMTQAKGRPTVLYQSLVSFWNKMIAPNKWQEVVKELSTHFCIIQIGAKQHCPGTVDLTEKTSILESIALASECDILLGGDSWMNHCSGFVKTPGVFVWTSTGPEDYGYPWNRNIWHPEVADCMPCGRPFRWLYDYDYKSKDTWERSEAGWVCPNKYCDGAISPSEIVEQVIDLYEERENVDFTFRNYVKELDKDIKKIRMVEEDYLISFIITVYDKIEKLPEVIQSIKDNCPYRYEIILVDNGDNGLHQYYKQPNVKVLDYTSNLGYSGGNNAGMEFAKGDYYIIVNPDMIIKDKRCIKQLVKYSGQTSISGKLVGTRDWYTYPASFPTYRVAGEIPFFYNQPTHDMPGWKPMPYIDGSLICIPKNIFEETGGFDTGLPELVYFDEAPLLFRAYLKGFKIVDAKIDPYIDHQHTDYATENVVKWTKANRQYFYETYALPNWNKFLKYLSGDSIKK